MTIGKIHGIGLDSSPVRGGTGVEGQGGKGLPGELGGVDVVGNGGGPVDNRGDGVWK